MAKSSGLKRGDKRRNAKLVRLRELVPFDHAIVAVDLADKTQAVAVTDHDSRVVARKAVKVTAWDLGPVLDWARQMAHKRGFADVTVGCEPTGYRWMVLDQLARERDMTLVCVNPMLVGNAREAEDYTRDKSDPKDAVVIARLVSQLNCYPPEQAEEAWAGLRQLGAHRERLITAATAGQQQLRDLLECVWPGVLEAAADPFGSTNWSAALMVVLQRCDGRPERLTRMGLARFEQAVCRELPRWSGTQRRRKIISAVFGALVDRTGVLSQRCGALQRARWVLDEWRTTKTRLAEVEAQMVAVLDKLGLTEYVITIPGVSAVGAAAMLAETGDPARFDISRTLVKHAGLCPRDNTTGKFQGQAKISRRGRPRLRLAAWRAVWGALPHNEVLSTRYRYLTTRQHNRLTDGQARAALAAALLRWLHVIATRKVSWDAAIAGAGAQPAAA